MDDNFDWQKQFQFWVVFLLLLNASSADLRFSPKDVILRIFPPHSFLNCSEIFMSLRLRLLFVWKYFPPNWNTPPPPIKRIISKLFRFLKLFLSYHVTCFFVRQNRILYYFTIRKFVWNCRLWFFMPWKVGGDFFSI